MKLCVTADDFGLHPATNRGIVRLAAAGAIDAVSVMAHAGAALAELPHLVRTGVAIGVHLVFVEERPLQATPALQRLLDRAGNLPKDWRILALRLAARPWLAAALATEAAAQVHHLRGMGIKVAFVNSHQHVHMLPALWRVLAPWLSDLGVAVRAVPFSRSQLTKTTGLKQWMLDAAGMVSTTARPLPPHVPILRPIGLDAAGHLDARSFHRLLKRASTTNYAATTTVELVVHPGDEDASLRAAYGHWRYHWAAERDVLLAAHADGIAASLGWTRHSPQPAAETSCP